MLDASLLHEVKIILTVLILFPLIRVSGYMMSDKLEIPRLKVKKDWHVGLHPDPVDRSHPDVHDEQLIQDAVTDLLSGKFVSLPFKHHLNLIFVQAASLRS